MKGTGGNTMKHRSLISFSHYLVCDSQYSHSQEAIGLQRRSMYVLFCYRISDLDNHFVFLSQEVVWKCFNSSTQSVIFLWMTWALAQDRRIRLWVTKSTRIHSTQAVFDTTMGSFTAEVFLDRVRGWSPFWQKYDTVSDVNLTDILRHSQTFSPWDAKMGVDTF